jgi:ribose 5-phosphate isomerase A
MGEEREHLKRQAALRALDCVESGMHIGLGSGSTMAHFIMLLGERIRHDGLCIQAVPTSCAVEEQARACGISVVTLEDVSILDITIDGADEIDANLNLIKGGGGALLREKIVARASKRVIIIADDSKMVDSLGHFPLPVAIVPFGHSATIERLKELLDALDMSGSLWLRQDKEGRPFLSDDGFYIADLALKEIAMPELLDKNLTQIPGVVCHGLFLGIACGAIIAKPGTIEIIGNV